MWKVEIVVFFCAFVLRRSKCEDVFRFANVYGSHMVLQQAPKRASVWGFGEVGRDVLLTFDGELYRADIISGRGNLGIWSVLLTPRKFGGPYTIKAFSVVGNKNVSIALEDVLFGDVWVCSGQSNMQFTVVQSDDGAQAIKDSIHYPNIRLFTAGLVCKDSPQVELKKVLLPWSAASPESVGGPAWQYFSAVCWYYAVQLYNEFKYPIGLIATTWGGTRVEAWSSPDALAACGIKTTEGYSSHERNVRGPHPSCLWNAMIYPFLNLTIYGSIWYQGEANAGQKLHPYNCTFPAMVDDWRAKWHASTHNNTDKLFPFGFVQLSSVGKNTKSQASHFAPLRWDQTAQFGYVPNKRQKNVFMAVAMDLGNPNSPFGSIHPTDKTDVGKRLALAGLAIAYGKRTYFTGPLLAGIKLQKRRRRLQKGALEVLYRSVNKSIEVKSKHGFEVHCEKGTWIDAPIIDQGPKSVVILPSSTECVADQVRYAWSDYPCPKLQCAVYSRGLPSPPFIKHGPFTNSRTPFEDFAEFLV